MCVRVHVVGRRARGFTFSLGNSNYGIATYLCINVFFHSWIFQWGVDTWGYMGEWGLSPRAALSYMICNKIKKKSRGRPVNQEEIIIFQLLTHIRYIDQQTHIPRYYTMEVLPQSPLLTRAVPVKRLTS